MATVLRKTGGGQNVSDKSITVPDFSELLAKIKADSLAAFTREPGTFTAREYAKAMSTSVPTAQRRLLVMADDGLIQRATLKRPSGWGFIRNVCGYKIPKGAKK